jgi:hypothetical protein
MLYKISTLFFFALVGNAVLIERPDRKYNQNHEVDGLNKGQTKHGYTAEYLDKFEHTLLQLFMETHNRPQIQPVCSN